MESRRLSRRVRRLTAVFVLALMCLGSAYAAYGSEADLPETETERQAGFHYMHDPRENPAAMKDIIVNPDAVYGFSPDPDSVRLGEFADSIDWSDPEQVAQAREQRWEYLMSFEELYRMIEDMLGRGDSVEKIARAVSKRRNELRLEAYKDDPEGLEAVRESNLETYGNEEGPQADDLYEKYGSWQTVLEKALSTNAGMDACLGLYDVNFFTYDIEAAREEMESGAPAASPKTVRRRGVLRVGTTGDYQPMSYLDPETGIYAGFDAALAEDLAESLGVRLEYVETSWPTLMEDTLAGKFDMAICGITVTDARKEQALMSEGYLENGKTILCRAEDANKYTSLEAVNRPEVRVMENPGGLNEKFARENLPDAELIIHDVNWEIPALIASGEADVMITEVMEAGYYVGQDDRLAAPLIYEPFTHGQLGVLMPKESEALLLYVNEFLEEEKEEGRIDELAEEYIYRYIDDKEEDEAAQPEDVIVSIDFDDGSVDGFETYLEGGACELRNEDGSLAADITNCGKVDYANQAYWDGFSLEKDCSYTYSFDISCSIDREIEYRLQLNGGDYHAYVGEKIRIGEEPVHISTDWTMTEESDPAPRLVFNMGHAEDMAEDPGEHTVWIDNISLVVLDDSGVAEDSGEQSGMLLSIDQAGYRPEDEKTVFIRCGETPAEQAAVLDESGAAVMELAPSEVFADAASGSDMQRADFTELSDPGTYRIRAAAGGEESFSEPFVIGSGVYTDLLADTVRMLSLQRCGTEVSLDPAFAHGACHDTPALILGTDQTKDVSGGWHDAGDYGRYVVAGAKAVSDLFLACDVFGMTADDLGIPESGNGIPDALDEARWELDWMLKMQDETSGGVYHKVTCRNFPGAVMPEEETDELVICPVSLTATADFAAVMARASVLYAPYDADFAQTARHAAQRAWAYAEDLDIGQGFLNPSEVSTGEYPDTEADDELAWAAAELYLAGVLGEGKAKDLLEQTGAHGLGWQCVADYALADLAMAEGNALRDTAKERLVQYADALLDKAASDGYYMTLGEDYPWGSNMAAADHGNIMLFAGRLTGDGKYAEAAKRHLDYLLGANPTGYCYVTGWGSVSPEHPHHRPSQAVGRAMPGMLVGGPDSHLEDPYVQNVLPGEAPARCYADNDQSYSTNEVTVYWNSPLVLLLAGVVNG